MKIKQIIKIPRNDEEVYNLTVEDNHNYYANGILVKNCHVLKRDNKINKIIKKIITPHKFSFTGTMPENPLDQWNIIGKIGPTIIDISSSRLRGENFISQVFATILEIHYRNPPKTVPNFDDPTEAYNDECAFIFENKFRNGIITHFAKNLTNNTLILVNQIKHGEILKELISKQAPEKVIYFVRGSMSQTIREEVRGLMEKQNNVVCIAMSKIFSTGINITNIHNIIFALGGKAKIRMLQSIGRGLRLHEKKDALQIIDIADVLEYGIEHSNRRNQLYENENIPFEIKTLHEK